MLADVRRLQVLDRQTRAGQWDKEASRGVNRQIHGMTVGLVGFGAIGRAVARLLLNFGATVLYYDPVQASSAVESELQVTRRPLDELLAASDLVSLHLPLMKERSEEHTSELQSLMRISYAVFCLKKKKN